MQVTQASDNFLWVEKYRPQNIEECIMPERYKTYFKQLIEKGEIQNLSLFGGAGTGKTTIAKVLCYHLDSDFIVINCSENGNIDTLRTKIRNFASSISLNGGVKCVILDEADGLTATTQQALRNFIEEFSNNCRFVFTANFANKIIEPLKSRTVTVDFVIKKDERKEVIVQWDKRVKEILKLEGVDYDSKVLATVIMKYFPDMRKTLNELQRYSVTGTLTTSVMNAMGDQAITDLVDLLKAKKFTEVRKWVVENSSNEFSTLARALWDHVDQHVDPSSIPQLVLHINNYDYKSSFVVDKEVHTVAFLTELMADIKFK